MGIDDLVNKAKDLIGDRDADSLKEDAAEVKDIITGEGSIADKAKAAFEAIKDPGAPGEGQ